MDEGASIPQKSNGLDRNSLKAACGEEIGFLGREAHAIEGAAGGLVAGAAVGSPSFIAGPEVGVPVTASAAAIGAVMGGTHMATNDRHHNERVKACAKALGAAPAKPPMP